MHSEEEQDDIAPDAHEPGDTELDPELEEYVHTGEIVEDYVDQPDPITGGDSQ